MSDKPTLYCNFCGKSQHEVDALIVGRDAVNICDACVDICGTICSEERAKARTAAHFRDVQENGT